MMHQRHGQPFHQSHLASEPICSAIFSSDKIVRIQMLTEAAGVSVGAEVLAEVATGVSEAVGVLVGEL